MTDAEVIAAAKDVIELSHDWISDYKRNFGIPMSHGPNVTGSGVTCALLRKIIINREPVTLTRVSEPVTINDVTTYRSLRNMVAGRERIPDHRRIDG